MFQNLSRCKDGPHQSYHVKHAQPSDSGRQSGRERKEPLGSDCQWHCFLRWRLPVRLHSEQRKNRHRNHFCGFLSCLAKAFYFFASLQPPRPLNYPMYKGCIEFSSVNDKVVSLYNFQKAEKVNSVTPCKRYDDDDDCWKEFHFKCVTMSDYFDTKAI